MGSMRHVLRQRFTGIKQGDNFSFESTIFVGCEFKDIVSEGAQIDSHFVKCSFDNVDWYWCIGHSPVFIDCDFNSCDLRGSFFSASFIECRFTGCNTGNDNLGGTTEWEDSVATQCTLVRTVLPIVAKDRTTTE